MAAYLLPFRGPVGADPFGADPSRLARALAMRRASAELTVAILAMATPAQRAHARQKFYDLIHDFTELSKDE